MKKLALMVAVMFTAIASSIIFSGCFERDYTFAEVGEEYVKMLNENTDIFTSGNVNIDYSVDVLNAITSAGATAPFASLRKITSSEYNVQAQLEPVFAAAILPVKTYYQATAEQSIFVAHNAKVPGGDATDLGRRLETLNSKLAAFKKSRYDLENKLGFNPEASFELDRLNKMVVKFKELNTAAIAFSKKFLSIYEKYIFVAGSYGGGFDEHLTSGLVRLELLKKAVEYAEIYSKTDMKLVLDVPYISFSALSDFQQVLGGYYLVENLNYPTFGVVGPKEQTMIDNYLNLESYNKVYMTELGMVNTALDRFNYNNVGKLYNDVEYRLPAEQLTYYNKVNEFFARELLNMRILVDKLTQSIVALNQP